MEKKVRDALDKSIEHWEENLRIAVDNEGCSIGPASTGFEVNGEIISVYVESCALCSLFYDDDCEGCPVNVNNLGCDGSPWADAVDMLRHYSIVHTETIEAIQREVEFLKGLRK